MAQAENNYRISLVIVILLILAVAYIGFLHIYPFKIAEVHSPAKTLTSTVNAGETLQYEIDYCIYVNSPVIITRRIINDMVITLPSIETVSKVGCGNDIVGTTVIPKTIPNGTYYMEITATHYINMFRKKTVSWDTEPFYIS